MSDEGFALAYGNKSITYSDDRGSFKFGLEDGFLFPKPKQVSGDSISLHRSQLDEMLERIIEGIKSDGHDVQVYRK